MAKTKRDLNRGFVRRAVVLSTLLMALLALSGLLYLKQRPALLQKRAAEAAAQGDYARAVRLLSSAERDEEAEALLLSYRYGAADKLLQSERWAEAETAFSALGSYADAREKILACRYGLAEEAFLAGEYEAAKDAFYALSGYGDALERYNACRYAIAKKTESLDPEQAFALFLELGSFSDARTQAERIAVAQTGMTNPENAVNRMLGVSEEEILARERLKTVRAGLRQHALAVGFYHTAGLKRDGTVVAAGRNSEGQCGVGAWTDITAIDCGAYHTVGLKRDGTVVAAGSNESGQCLVAEWTDIVMIACTDYDTIGLRRDGTLVHTGYHAYPELAGWSGIVSIGGGSYALVALTETGQALSTHASSRDERLSGALTLDASTGYAVGLMENGTVLLGGEPLPGWSEAVAVAAGSTGVLGIASDGKVLAHWFRARDALDFSDIADAAAVAAGGTHSAVLRSDGSVVARGGNDYGECSTADWNLGKAE